MHGLVAALPHQDVHGDLIDCGVNDYRRTAPGPRTGSERARCMSMNRFERISIVFLGAVVGAAGLAMWVQPPSSAAHVPRAYLDAPEAAGGKSSAQPDRQHGIADDAVIVVASTGTPSSVSRLSSAFSRMNYDLSSVVTGDGRVPRLFLASLPSDMNAISEVDKRKSLFFKSVLPLILQINEEIQGQRERLWRLRFKKRMEQRLSAADRLWLMVMGDRYDVADADIDTLLRRVDVIPPSLALAQAAEESGWGTSRFAREGNALFGQWVYTDKVHLKPRARESGKSHQVMAFDSLLDAVRAYAVNLNTHRAYTEFRKRRWGMRRAGNPIDGNDLAGTMLRYSERGKDYVRSLRTIISVNDLEGLDGARLHEEDDPADNQPSI